MVEVRVTELEQQQAHQLNHFFTSSMMQNKPPIVSYVLAAESFFCSIMSGGNGYWNSLNAIELIVHNSSFVFAVWFVVE
jgi:hypothetical protein